MNTMKVSLLVLIALAVNLSVWANNAKTLPLRTEVSLTGISLPPGFIRSAGYRTARKPL